MQLHETKKRVIFGIGNQNRGDDGAAWALLQLLEKAHFPAAFHYVYHLQIEHALLVASAESVLFIDATQQCLPHGFSWQPCQVEAQTAVFSHELSPHYLLFLTQTLYSIIPLAHLLVIQGNQWDFYNKLSESAQQNVRNAYQFLKNEISDWK